MRHVAIKRSAALSTIVHSCILHHGSQARPFRQFVFRMGSNQSHALHTTIGTRACLPSANWCAAVQTRVRPAHIVHKAFDDVQHLASLRKKQNPMPLGCSTVGRRARNANGDLQKRGALMEQNSKTVPAGSRRGACKKSHRY